MNFTSDFEKRRFFNCLHGLKSPWLVCSLHEDKSPNLALFSNVFHLGADPALIGMVCRPQEATRHTTVNIIRDHYWTLNSVHKEILNSSHQASAKYPKEYDDFSGLGLTRFDHNEFSVPFIYESKIKIGLKLVKSIPIDLNQTTILIGQVDLIEIDDIYVIEGRVQFSQMNHVVVGGLDQYFSIDAYKVLSYAKPDQKIKILKE